MLRNTRVALALSVARGLAPLAAWAQQTPSPEAAEVLRPVEIAVSAPRAAPGGRRARHGPGRPRGCDRKVRCARHQGRLSRRDRRGGACRPDALRRSGAATGRAGNEGINSLGLQGNHGCCRLNGIPEADSFSFGSYATGHVISSMSRECRRSKCCAGASRWIEWAPTTSCTRCCVRRQRRSRALARPRPVRRRNRAPARHDPLLSSHQEPPR